MKRLVWIFLLLTPLSVGAAFGQTQDRIRPVTVRIRLNPRHRWMMLTT